MAPPLAAGVLIGGQSRRMGACKATLPWGGSTIVETIVRSARQVASDCVLLGEGPGLPASLTGMQRLPDDWPGIGPIAGLHALLRHRPGRWCLLLSCDIPYVTTAAMTDLVTHIDQAKRIVAYRCGGRLEPCCTLYHGGLLGDVAEAIRAGAYSLTDLIAARDRVEIPASSAARRALRNLNTPNDYHPPPPDGLRT